MEHYARLEASDVREKAANDMVTTVDVAAQASIVEAIRRRFPGDYIVAEEQLDESINEGRDPAGRRWIIDPLDGTTNYIHGYPMFAVSIAFADAAGLEVGVTYAPYTDDLYEASRGGGARLNGRPMRVSTVEDPTRILLGTGFPFRARHYLDVYLRTFAWFFERARGIRRAGSAALDFAWVASGRLDGFWEMTLSPWDIAAGVVLVEEAGGRVSDFFGEATYLESGHVVASNGRIHEAMTEALERIVPRDLDFTRRS